MYGSSLVNFHMEQLDLNPIRKINRKIEYHHHQSWRLGLTGEGLYDVWKQRQQEVRKDLEAEKLMFRRRRAEKEMGKEKIEKVDGLECDIMAPRLSSTMRINSLGILINYVFEQLRQNQASGLSELIGEGL